MTRKDYEEAMRAAEMSGALPDPDSMGWAMFKREAFAHAMRNMDKPLSPRDVTPAGWASKGEGVEL